MSNTHPLMPIHWNGNISQCSTGTSSDYGCMLGKTKNSIVPKWSRPVENMGHRNPDWDSTSYVIMPGNHDAQLRDLGPKFKARPIKHWRKQLQPRTTTGLSTSGVGMPMDTPGGSVYLANDDHQCCDVSSSYHMSTYVPKQPQYNNTTYLNVSAQCNPVDPVFNKRLCCNPPKNVIKSAVTLLKKNYYTDTRGYLKSRCRTYEQRLSGTELPGNVYWNDTGATKIVDGVAVPVQTPAWPSNDPSGAQVRAMKNCYKACPSGGPNPTTHCPNGGAPGVFNAAASTTIYKPSNPQFAVQGAVSSSTRLDRLKLNTIQKSANHQRTAWGEQSARAAAYRGKPEAPYYLKSKYSGDTKCKSVYRRRGNHTLCFNTPCHKTADGSGWCNQVGGQIGVRMATS